MSKIEELAKYVSERSAVGDCDCETCKSGYPDSLRQHVVDMVFFKVRNNGATSEELSRLCSESVCGDFCSVNVFDGKEHGFIELGGWIGDQGLALKLMGLGYLLGLWSVITPLSIGAGRELAMTMAGQGMISIVPKKTVSDPVASSF